LGFFGLTPKDKPTLHEKIFQLMYYGQGFTHSDVYDMPIYLRNFYYNKLVETRKKENDEVRKAQQKSKSKVSKPAINPRFKR
tara:strand:- start:806 stop:1051 length:246 start_codon:yes stop_codon:yes gene_type:complete